MEKVIDLKKDVETALDLNRVCDFEVTAIKEQIFDRFVDQSQQIMVLHYFRILTELCTQAGNAILTSAFSSAEALTRVIIEQAANQLYIALDEGNRARSLIRSSKLLTQKNGKNWVSFLESQGATNPAAYLRRNSGERLLAAFDEKWTDTERYPNGKKLFECLGWENHYHAFYAPLCDSVHSYSDDMANLVFLFELSANLGDDLEMHMKAVEVERHRLATYHFATAVGLRAEALARICERLNISLSPEQLQPAFDELQKALNRHESYDHGRIERIRSVD